MAINVFEGARRVAKLFSWLMVVIAIIIAFNQTTYVEVNYYISRPDAQAVKVDSLDCRFTIDKSMDFYLTTSSGKKVKVSLCFIAHDFSGKLLVPYTEELKTGILWGGDTYSKEVEQYANRVKSSFRLAHDEEEWIDKKWRWEKWKDLGEIFFWLFISLALFQLFIWVVGWVVRGFMEIPLGTDHRENKVDTSPSHEEH